MKTLIVGVGALGGLIAARLRATGSPVWLAARTAEAAASLKASGLVVTGVGGAASVRVEDVAAVDDYRGRDAFELIVLATKAHDAIDVAPKLPGLLGPGGTLLPIQNGFVAQAIADRLGGDRVLGGLSNLGASMTSLGVYEQRNAGHLLVGELPGGESERCEQVRRWLGRAVEVRSTPNLRGAVWSKLLLNCSVTTIGAISGQTMRRYIASPEGRELFDRTYDEALSVALASGARPERMLVEPIPPGWNGRSVPGEAHEAWLGRVLNGYGDVKPSMLQDFERGRTTEVDFVNGHVVAVGGELGVRTPANAAIVRTVREITSGQLAPDATLLRRALLASRSQ